MVISVLYLKSQGNCIVTPYSTKKEEEKREDEEEDEEEQNEMADYLIPKEQLEKIKKSGKNYLQNDNVLQKV